MPDQKLNLPLTLLFQNHGRLSRRKRETRFEEITDAEIAAIEGAYTEIFELETKT